MKVLFICGALEPGKDGVGDYTRRLAGELIRQGHNANIIAYNDRHINQVIDSVQLDEDTAINILRLPSAFRAKEKVKLARDYVQQFRPDWISLQFVIYSFHPKGLPFFLAGQLKQIGEGYRWHIMFHELWIGMNKERLFKERSIGFLQKNIIVNLIKQLNVQRINTHANLYFFMVKKLWPTKMSRKLPLFSNIKISSTGSNDRKGTIIFALFGGILPYTNIKAFIDWCTSQQEEIKKDIEFYFIGKNGQVLKQWTQMLESSKLQHTVFGFQDEDRVSDLLAHSDIGITTTPLPLVEKSGAVAAYLSARRPVLCTSTLWTVDQLNIQRDTHIYQWNPDMELTDIFTEEVDIDRSLKTIGRHFINHLTHG